MVHKSVIGTLVAGAVACLVAGTVSYRRPVNLRSSDPPPNLVVEWSNGRLGIWFFSLAGPEQTDWKTTRLVRRGFELARHPKVDFPSDPENDLDIRHVTVPTFAFYEIDGTWGIEGHGVEPDLEVIADAAKMVDGGDPQLEAAIEHMQTEIKRNPHRPPPRPVHPDRSGMGITEEDK